MALLSRVSITRPEVLFCAAQEGQTILVQEYLENGDLFHAIAEDTQSRRFGWYRQRLPSGRLAPNTGMARRIALDIARGLFFLHSRKCGPSSPQPQATTLCTHRVSAVVGPNCLEPRSPRDLCKVQSFLTLAWSLSYSTCS